MLAVRYQGRTLKLNDLAVGELDEVNARAGARVIAALVRGLGLDPDQIRLGDLEILGTEPDGLPDMWQEGIPAMGGRLMDPYVVAFGRPPYCWPPEVTRAQRLRDLDLILSSIGATG